MLTNKTPEYFLTVAREGNISRAAEKLFISQPSLSQHIAKLEEGLGALLFDRSKTPLALTPAGEIYRDYLKSSGYLYQKLCADLSAIDDEKAQAVSLGIGNWRGSILLPEILPEFLREYPRARVSLHEYPISEMTSLIRDGKVDFAVMNTTPSSTPDDLVVEVVAFEKIFLVLNRRDEICQTLSALRDSGKKIDLSLLVDRRFIALSDTLTVGRCLNNYLGKKRVSFPHKLSATDNETILRLVAAGAGFCFLVESGLRDAARYPELICFDIASPDLSLPISLCYKGSSFLSPMAKNLIARIRQFYHSELRR